MSSEGILEYFGNPDGDEYSNIIGKLLIYYNRRSKFYKKVYYILSGSRIVMTALIPVFVIMESPLLSNGIVALLSAGALIAEGFLGISHAQDKWKSYRQTCDQLCSEQRFYCTKKGIYNGIEDPSEVFVINCEKIIKEEGSRWKEYIQETKSVSNSG